MKALKALALVLLATFSYTAVNAQVHHRAHHKVVHHYRHHRIVHHTVMHHN